MFMYIYNYHIPITSECITDEDCSGASNASDTCISNICHCGTNLNCTLVSDTCTAGQCKCGENDECLSSQTCSNGTCNEGKLLPVSKMFLPLVVFQIICMYSSITYYIDTYLLHIYCDLSSWFTVISRRRNL